MSDYTRSAQRGGERSTWQGLRSDKGNTREQGDGTGGAGRGGRAECQCRRIGSTAMRSAGQLVVDQRVHAAEITRFHSHVVCGPTASDCNIWTGAIGADGYGQLYLTRERSGLCVRPHRYALAIVSGVVAAGVLGLHECDNRCASRSRRQQNPISTSVRPAG